MSNAVIVFESNQLPEFLGNSKHIIYHSSLKKFNMASLIFWPGWTG